MKGEKRVDFSTIEPKPEIIRNGQKQTFPPERHVVDRNKQDILNFFNVSPKTRIALSVSAAGILLFFFSIFTGVFQNPSFDTLYPKDQSQASQSIPVPTMTGPGFSLIGDSVAKIQQPYTLDVNVNTGTESATIMVAQVRFDPKFFEVQSVLTDNSVVLDWIDNNVSNTDGMISLVASFPKGYVAKPGDNMAKIIMTPKIAGQTTVYVDSKNSQIFRMGDKAAIKIEHDQRAIEIK